MSATSSVITLHDIIIKKNEALEWQEAILLELQVPCRMHFRTMFSGACLSTDSDMEIVDATNLSKHSFEINVLCVSKDVADEVYRALVSDTQTQRLKKVDTASRQHENAISSWTSAVQDFFNARLLPCVDHCTGAECETPIPGRQWSIQNISIDLYQKVLDSYPLHFIVKAPTPESTQNYNYHTTIHSALNKLQIMYNWIGFKDLTKSMEQRMFLNHLEELRESKKKFSATPHDIRNVNVDSKNMNGRCHIRNKDVIEIDTEK